MKKKAIEKIPYLTAEKCREKDVKFVAAVAVIQIQGEQHLFLEIYENKAKCLNIPVYRFVYTKKDWANYRPADGTWSACKIVNIYKDLIWQNNSNEQETFISKIDIEYMKEFTGREINRWRSWWNLLDQLEDSINKERWKRSMGRRNERLNARCAEIRELPGDFEDWYKNVLFARENYIYYKRKGRYATFWCSHCGKSYTYATERKDTFEGQFETVVTVPKNGTHARCMECDAEGVYKAAGKMKDVHGISKYCYVCQPYKEAGAVSRYINVEKILSIGEPERYVVTELARSFFEPGKKRITDYQLHSYYTGKNEWCDHNVGFGGGNINESASAIYPGTYEELKNTMFEYSGLKECNREYERIEVADYLETYMKYPILEMMAKTGMYQLIGNLMKGYFVSSYIKNENAKDPEKMLGINHGRLKLLVKQHGEIGLLRILQAEHEMNAAWTEEQCLKLAGLDLDTSKFKKTLQWVTVQKFLNRVEKYAGVSISAMALDRMCSAAIGISRSAANTYMDYLYMRARLGYDMTNTVYLYPRDLEAAHRQMTDEQNKAVLDKRIREVEEKYANIKKIYWRLRNRYYYEDDNMLIRPARSAEEIVQEGRTLHHCVGGDGYLQKHNEEKTTILMLRFKALPETPYITVEIEGMRIIQWYGANDKKPDRENMQRWLDAYVTRLKYQGNAMDNETGADTAKHTLVPAAG